MSLAAVSATAAPVTAAAFAATTSATNTTNNDIHFLNRSERVKSVDFHPTHPWVLTALITGTVEVWNVDSHALVKTIQVSTGPVRTARFIARKNWIVTGADDATVRVFDLETNALVASFKAHDDYIRFVDVHPSKPFVLTSSDDKSIKLWDWDREWQCVQTFVGHDHYVMQAKFNPVDPNVVVSASLDHSVRVWSLTSGNNLSVASLGEIFSVSALDGHTAGVNCVDFFSTEGGKTFILSGSDDKTVKVWDLATQTVIKTLVGHTNNVTAVLKHPFLPLIVSAAEDDTVRTWSASTFHAEGILNCDLSRAWTLSALPGSVSIAIGYDHGSVVADLAVGGIATRTGTTQAARL